MQSNRTANTSAKAIEKSQQYETVNFHKTSSQPSERARADYDLTVQRDWARNDRRIPGHRTTRDSPMLQRWQNETTKEQPYNAIKTTERAGGQSGGRKGGRGTTVQAQSSSRESPMLQRWRTESAKEQPYHAIGAVGVRRDRSFIHQKEEKRPSRKETVYDFYVEGKCEKRNLEVFEGEDVFLFYRMIIGNSSSPRPNEYKTKTPPHQRH